jgi:phosphotransferase system enzyme I (PtsP)
MDKLAGIVSLSGSRNSHIAILARSLGVPTVMGAVDLPYTLLEGSELIVDGYRGSVVANPSQQVREHYQEVLSEDRKLVESLEAIKTLPSETMDGESFELWVNTGLVSDARVSLDRGAEGVGLYRTEVPFMMRDRFPSEDEQVEVYRSQLTTFSPRPVTMRTLDVGGDKALPYFPIVEDNPFLGWRGIRVTLDHPEIFLTQIRAMLKASDGLDNLRIMLPMICSVSELDISRILIERAYNEVVEEGFNVVFPPIGVMIEVPAAIYQIKQLAERVDFLSVGSNDLTQYLLAVDRNNPRVADLYHSLHPAVLSALADIASEAQNAGKPVSVCGELAGDPGGAMLLLAMGYSTLSMSVTNLLKVKSTLRAISKEQLNSLLDEVLSLSDSNSVNQRLNRAFKDAGLERVMRIDSDISDLH